MTAEAPSRETRAGLLPSWPTAITLAATFVGLLAITWRRWGHPRIDCGGALDRAARMAAGEQLYRDVQSLYPPLADYLLSSAFSMFGTRLEVAYALGTCMLLVESALLWVIGRRVLDELGTVAVLCVFWLYMGFWPGLGGWILPNTFSMTLGATCATAVLALAMAYQERPTTARMIAASCCAGMAGLAKLEFGAAAAGTMLLAMFLAPAEHRRKGILALIVPAFLVVAVVMLPLGLRVGWTMLVSDGLMRTRSLAVTLSGQEVALGHMARWPGLVGGVVADLVALPARAVLLAWAVWLARGRAWQRLCAALPLGAAVAMLVWPLWGAGILAFLAPILPSLAVSKSLDGLSVFLAQIELTSPILVSPAVAVLMWVWIARTRSPCRSDVALAATFTAMLVVRWGFRATWYSYYGFLSPLFVVVAARAITRAAVGRAADVVVPVMLLATLIMPVAALATAMRKMTYALDYPRGRMLVSWGEGRPVASAIDYVRTHSSPDETVAVLPEERLINFLTERRNPTPDSGIGPGWLATDADVDAYLAALEAAHPRLIVVSKRSYPEFGQGSIEEYAPRVMEWIRAHYRVGRAGWFTVYERPSGNAVAAPRHVE